MNLIIIANCQVQPLQKLFSMSPDIDNIVAIPIHLLGHKLYEDSVNSFYELIKRDSNATIISFPLLGDFKDFETKELRQRVKNLYTINNIHFSGLHPDVTYLSEIGRRVPSPVGDYHSKIILYSYLKKFPKEKCLEFFCKFSYEQLSYFKEFESSGDALLDREKDVDIKFATKYLSIAKKNHSMFTFNHPTSFIFHNWMQVMSEFLKIRFPSVDPLMEQNFLSNNTWWPVYPEIADALACDYKGSYFFKQNESCGGKFLNIEEMISHSYEAYSRNDDIIRSSRQVIDLEFNFDKKITL